MRSFAKARMHMTDYCTHSDLWRWQTGPTCGLEEMESSDARDRSRAEADPAMPSSQRHHRQTNRAAEQARYLGGDAVHSRCMPSPDRRVSAALLPTSIACGDEMGSS